jgi:adenosylhomocysteine nucleosidase
VDWRVFQWLLSVFYLDPGLLGYLACSAKRVAAHTSVDLWANPDYPLKTPQIFYFGVQGTSTMWLANPEFIAKTHRAFHEIDEDGDWYSNLAATLYHVPFIEVSVISDSILEFPETERGLPTPPEGQKPTGFLAQRISNQIAVDLIRHFGREILNGTFATPEERPFPAAYFTDPTNPQDLLKGLDCR